MRVFLTVLFCGAALALPNGRVLRPEEHWRPAAARDLSKYTPRHALVQAKSSPVEHEFVTLARSIRSNKQSKSTHKASSYDLAADCGIEGPPSKDKIVGGHEAQEHQWPWTVALFIDDAWFCTGALISENYVLTAAHCADGATYFDIMAGAHNVRESSEPHRVEITSFNGWTHPQWDPNTLSNDIALVELPEPISFNAECNAIYGIVGDGVVCIDTAGGKGTCSGDSGGPLNMKFDVVDKEGNPGQKWKQVGVVSFGASAGCEVGYPAGFTRNAYFMDWICSETNGVGC